MEKQERIRLHVDMDGTLAVFQPVDELETLYEEGYFRNLEPHENVVEAIREIITNKQDYPDIEVSVLSAYLTDSAYALEEKNAWLDKYLPEIDPEHRIFVACGSDKKEGIEGGIRQNDFLLDDYTQNLNDWQPPARGIKLLNAINHTRGTWAHDRIRYDRSPKELAQAIVDVMRNERHIYDEKVQPDKEVRKNMDNGLKAAPTELAERIVDYYENHLPDFMPPELKALDRESRIHEVTDKLLQNRGSRYFQNMEESIVQSVMDYERREYPVDHNLSTRMYDMGYELVTRNGFHDDYLQWRARGLENYVFGTEGWNGVRGFLEDVKELTGGSYSLAEIKEMKNQPDCPFQEEAVKRGLQELSMRERKIKPVPVEYQDDNGKVIPNAMLHMEYQGNGQVSFSVTAENHKVTGNYNMFAGYSHSDGPIHNWNEGFEKVLYDNTCKPYFESDEKEVPEKAAPEENVPVPEGEKKTFPEPPKGQTPAYQGFANYKGGFTIITGESAEDILKKAMDLNKERSTEQQYQNCNIGQYQPEQGKYGNYQRYAVGTGENISKIYLEIPQGIRREEFKKLTETFKENGAHFSHEKRKWYITADKKDQFRDYLPKEIAPFKGFANAPGNSVTVYGASAEDVLKKVNEMNRDRGLDLQYKTCSIAEYDEKAGNYWSYKKYDVMTGKDISPLYLEIPKGLNKEQFNQIREQIKKMGAKYNPNKKSWYISQDQKDQFRDYLPGASEKEAEQTAQKKEQPSLEEEIQEESGLKYLDSIDNQYVVRLTNGDELRLNQESIMKKAGVLRWEDISNDKLVDVLADAAKEHMEQLPSQTEGFLYEKGKEVKIPVPEYTVDERGFREVTGMKYLDGIVQQENAESIMLQKADGNIETVNKAEIYNAAQEKIMAAVVEKNLSNQEIDLIGQPNLNAEQMNQLFSGLKEGLCFEQVVCFGNPKIEVWQMEVYRYGMKNGLPFDTLTEMMKDSQSLSGSRELVDKVDKMVQAQRNLIIKDLKENGIRPVKSLVSKIEKLNGMSGKINSVKDITDKVRHGYLRDNSVGKLYKEVGEEMKSARGYKAPAPASKLPQVPIQ